MKPVEVRKQKYGGNLSQGCRSKMRFSLYCLLEMIMCVEIQREVDNTVS